MKTIHYSCAPPRTNPFDADVRVLFSRKDIDVIHLQLEPGKMLSKVTIATDAFFFVLEGSPEISVGDETQATEAQTLVFCPGGSAHCISNPGKEQSRILILKML